ncbi:hypothetical protein Yangon222_00370 [Helicobacter pylori]
MYGDQRRKEMEQLIEVIEANSGKSLHYETYQDETQQANKTKKMWYLAITLLISLAILAVFFIKREHQPNNNASNSQESGVKKLTPKIPTQRTTKRVAATLKHKTTPNAKTIKKQKPKSVKESEIPFIV